MTQQPVPKLIHAGFYCRDVDASAAWYKEVLGMNPQFGREGRNAALRFDDAEGHHIYLAQAPKSYEPHTPMVFEHETLTPMSGRIGFYHIAIDFGSFDAAMEAFGRAMAKGSAIGKAAEHGYGRGFYVRDPDGNLVELWAYKQDGDEEKIAPLTERFVNDEPRGGGYALDARATYEKWKAHRAATVGA